jgi:kynurenine formamidase
MGKKRLVDLSHPFGDKVPLWPYFADVKIERMHYHAKSGVLSQVITTTTHCTTHAGFPIRWHKGDGSIVRLVAIVDEGDQ